VSPVEAVFVFENFLENTVFVLGHLLAQLFHLALQLTRLSHCNMVEHVEITLFSSLVRQEGSKCTSRIFLNPFEVLDDALVLALDSAPHLLDQFAPRLHLWLSLLTPSGYSFFFYLHC
jgi:hypothetical protein